MKTSSLKWLETVAVFVAMCWFLIWEVLNPEPAKRDRSLPPATSRAIARRIKLAQAGPGLAASGEAIEKGEVLEVEGKRHHDEEGPHGGV